jgi:hypothetical protein
VAAPEAPPTAPPIPQPPLVITHYWALLLGPSLTATADEAVSDEVIANAVVTDEIVAGEVVTFDSG